MAKSSFFTQLRAILIRNFWLKLRGKKQTLTELIAPLYFIIILIIVEIGIPPTSLPSLTQPQTAYDISDLGALFGQTVDVVGSDDFDDIVSTLTTKLSAGSVATLRFYDETSFEDHYNQNYSEINLAVVFHNRSSDNVTYTIRPSLDLGLPDLSSLYATEDKCHPLWDDDPSNFKSNEMKCSCPARAYYDVGFVQLQALVDASIFKNLYGQDFLLNMTVVVFPKDEFKGNTDLMRSLVPLYMAIAFTPFVAFLCILIVGEKEKKIKDAMKLMGLRESVYWLGWLITYGVLVILLSIITAVLLVVAGITPHANIFLLFVLLALYGFSTISVSFLVTPFFSSAKAAGGFASLASMLFSILYYVSVYATDVPIAAYYAMSLLSPTAFALGMDKVVYLDQVEDGINFSNFWEDGTFCFGSSVIMLAVDIILYALLAYYCDNVVPGEYGRKRRPWFFLMPSYWCPKPKTGVQMADLEAIAEGIANNPNFEKVSNDLKGKEGLRIFDIRKVFSGCTIDEMVAVDGVSLDIYKGQITAILGHNGAGKTTLMNILVGLTTPTSGTATIEGLDIADPNNYDLIWEMVGICPQQDVLFDVLTPEQHLKFFGRLKGIPEKQLEKVVDRILEEVDLMERKDAPAVKLSGGQKRKLSIAIALIGDSKVIILDEPTSGVDPYSRRILWNLLQQLKKDRIIILTTHFMDEADILADRKAIMSHGKVQCVGSSLFLKNRFGLGYHLTMVVENTFDEEGIAALIQDHIPKGEKARGNATELAYRLPFDEVSKFPALLTALDKAVQKIEPNDKLGIKSYGVSMTTLEEVFLKLGEDSHLNNASSAEAHKNLSNGSRRSSSDGKARPIEYSTAEYNWVQAFIAMMKINILTVLRLPRQIVTTVIIPIILIVVTFYLLTLPTGIEDSTQQVQLDFSMYPSYNVVVVTNNDSIDLEPFLSQLDNLGIPHTSFPQSFAELLNYTPHHFYLNITAFQPSMMSMSLEASYNDTAQHSLPILVNMLTNTLTANPPIAINTFIQPLPRHQKPNVFYATTYSAIFLIGFAYTMITAVYCADSVDDRETKVRHQLQVSGLPFTVYWFSKFLGNFVLFCITLVATIIVIVAFQVEPFTEGAPLGILILGYVLYIFAGLFSGYCFGFLFKKYDTAQSFLPVFSMIVGFAPYVAVTLCDMLLTNGKTALILHCVFTVLLPWYSPYAITYFLSKAYLDNQWTNETMSGKDYFTEQVIVTLVVLPIQTVLCIGLLWVLDFRSLNGQWSEVFHCCQSKTKTTDSMMVNDDIPDLEDDDIREERRRVQNLVGNADDSQEAVVIMQGMRKEFVTKKSSAFQQCSKKKSAKSKVKLAVRNLSLAVDKGEVFGLLGPNGAGKTTTLRTMVADETPTMGKVYVAGYDMSTDLKQAIRKMGYCPQHDAVWKSITVREHLECYASIRGIKRSEISRVVDSLLEGLQISEHAKKKTQHLSGGTKRKLSYAISMLGNPKIVLLDEPSTGMDPQSKRYLWDTILDSFQGERGAVLTTHSMEEADFLCSRVGIMVQGELRCIGATQHLKNKFGSGYVLEAKLLASHQRSSKFGSLHDAIKAIFTEATVQERFEDRVKYHIPQTGNLSLAQIFSTLEEAKEKIGIEEYSFSQTTLEQIFLEFAKLQLYEGGRKDSKLEQTHF